MLMSAHIYSRREGYGVRDRHTEGLLRCQGRDLLEQIAKDLLSHGVNLRVGTKVRHSGATVAWDYMGHALRNNISMSQVTGCS